MLRLAHMIFILIITGVKCKSVSCMHVCKSKHILNKWTIQLNAQRYGQKALEQSNTLNESIYLASYSINKAKSASERPLTADLRSQTDHILRHWGDLEWPNSSKKKTKKNLLLFQFANHTHWALKPNHRGGGEPRGLGVCHSILLHKKKVKDAVWAIGSNWQRIGHGQPSEWKSTWECSIWTSKGHKRPMADNEATQRSLAAVE